MNRVATHTTLSALAVSLLLLQPDLHAVADEPPAEPDAVVAVPALSATESAVATTEQATAEDAALANTVEAADAAATSTGDDSDATAVTAVRPREAAAPSAQDGEPELSPEPSADAEMLETSEPAVAGEEIGELQPTVPPEQDYAASESVAAPAPAEVVFELQTEPAAAESPDDAQQTADSAVHRDTADAASPEEMPEDDSSGVELSAYGPGINPEEAGVAIDSLSADSERAADASGGPKSAVPLAEAVTIAEENAAHSLQLLNTEVPPGTYQRLSWSATELFEGVPIATPVLVVNGTLPGPTLCLSAAVHGDELNGIEMVRRVMHDLDPQKLSGAVIGVPIVNLQGFRSGSRYLPDRRDLNRYFPGNPNGSAASRIAYSFFTEVIRNCDALIDLHTGSFDRANLPQLRADLRNPDVVTLTHGFGATVILHSDPAQGTLRHAASAAGIATVTLEAGGPSELELKEVMHGVKGIETLLNTLGMVRKVRLWGDPEPVYYRSVWVRADRGGILLSDVSLGSTVRRGDLLGTITDPMNNASTNLYAPFSGRVIGMARNQVVMPGFAAFHVGIQTPEPSAAGVGADNSDEALVHDSEASNDDYIDGMSE